MAINRRQFLEVAGAAAIFPRQAQRQRYSTPNVLHLMCDQMRWDAICGRSQSRTLNINSLAAQGIRFERSYTPVSLCVPARAALISGAFPWHNRMYAEIMSPTVITRDMYHNEVTVPQRLHEVGYIQGYVGKWHVSWLRTPLDFGYDEIAAPVVYNPRLLKGIDTNPDHVRCLPPKGMDTNPGQVRCPPPSRRPHPHVTRWMQWPGSKPFPMWGYYTDLPEEDTESYWIAENAIPMMKRFAASGKPWHVEVHFEVPHDPYIPLKKYVDQYNPADIPVAPSFYDTFQGKPDLHRHESEIWGKVTEEDFRQSRAYYFAFCAEVDTQIGRVLKALEETGQVENTLVTLTADHGDMLGAHRMWIKDWMPYEDTHRIPMVIRWPARIRPGSVSHRLVQLHDLAHTYVEAGGADPLPYAEGRSLLPLLDDPNGANWPDQVLSVYYGNEYYFTQRMVITERYKYVFNGIDFDECYDLQNDPHEMRNVVNDPSYTRVVDDMRARLWELMNQFGDPYGDVGPNLPDTGPPNRYTGPRYLARGRRITDKK